MPRRISSGTHGTAATGPAVALLAAAICLATAPRLMPAGYSWVAHTTSESAAQGVEGAWLARLGFVLFGLGVIWLASHCRFRWGVWGVRLHVAFGVFMTAAAAFSDRPWQPGATFDPVEVALHTVASTAMGFAFALGVLAVMLTRLRSGSRGVAIDILAMAASTLLPLAMSFWENLDGALQRLLFVGALLWYLCEALSLRAAHRSPTRSSPR